MEHLVLCGCSRSGTSMFYSMLATTVNNFGFFDGEKPADKVFGDKIISKRPLDVLRMDVLNNKKDNLLFLIMIRDPRDIITSYHQSVPDDYFVGGDYMYFIPTNNKPIPTNPGIDKHAEAIRSRPSNSILIFYEDLLQDPDAYQKILGEKTGVKYNSNRYFSRFNEYIDNIPEGVVPALNSLRSPDSSNIKRWQKHPERIKEQFNKHPFMFDLLKEYGYEQDDEWFKQL